MAIGPTTAKAPPSPGRLASALARFLSNRGATALPAASIASHSVDRPPDSWDEWISDPVSTAFLAGTGNRQARSRQQVYQLWQDMLADPVVSSALRLHVTSALGGHESRGEMVFIEATAEAKKDKDLLALVESLAKDLQPMFNRIAPTVCFNACSFGDAYGRIYAMPKIGVQDVYTDELIYPPLVQPYERANVTVGYTVATGPKFNEKLTVLQVARMKMPRMLYLPQTRVIEKSVRIALTTDDMADLPAVPGLAGGSFLDGAETAYSKFSAAWTGLVGQRVQDSVNESLISVQQTGMTPNQRAKFKASLAAMFERSNAYINEVVQRGQAVFGRIYHFIPTSSDKQMTAINGATSAGRPSSLTIDDVMMHARFLAGALGVDLSMLGFADQLGGGLGEGGFFRVSAQAAERARNIRAALTEFFNHIIAVHLHHKHGIDFHGQDFPWQVNYFSGISALEAERAKTKADAMNAGALLVQTLAQLKDLGIDEEAMAHMLQTELGLDAADAKAYAKALKNAKPPDDGSGGGMGGGGFGGPPGAGGGTDPIDPEGGDEAAP